ncbi:hypothetical protein D3C71_1179380 [compost metagenome]
MSTSAASDSSRRFSNMPPCTMPNSAFGFERRVNSAWQRLAQRRLSSIETRASASVVMWPLVS